jgi:hypothetical protein
MNRIAYKALCPTCGQDMAEFSPIPPVNLNPSAPSTPTPINTNPVVSPDTSTVNPAIAEATVNAFLSSNPTIPATDASSPPATDPTLTTAQAELNKAAQSVEPVTASISPASESLTEFSLTPSA